MYHCAACRAVVAVLRADSGSVVIVRSCECDAAIVADMSTTLEGHSDVGAR